MVSKNIGVLVRRLAPSTKKMEWYFPEIAQDYSICEWSECQNIVEDIIGLLSNDRKELLELAGEVGITVDLLHSIAVELDSYSEDVWEVDYWDGRTDRTWEEMRCLLRLDVLELGRIIDAVEKAPAGSYEIALYYSY